MFSRDTICWTVKVLVLSLPCTIRACDPWAAAACDDLCTCITDTVPPSAPSCWFLSGVHLWRSACQLPPWTHVETANTALCRGWNQPLPPRYRVRLRVHPPTLTTTRVSHPRLHPSSGRLRRTWRFWASPPAELPPPAKLGVRVHPRTAPTSPSQPRPRASAGGGPRCPLRRPSRPAARRRPRRTLTQRRPHPLPSKSLSSSRHPTSTCLRLCHRPAGPRASARTWSAPSASASSTTSSAAPRCSSADTPSAWSAWRASTSSRPSRAPSSARCAVASRPCPPSACPNWPRTRPCWPTCPPPCRRSTASASSATRGSCRSGGQFALLLTRD